MKDLNGYNNNCQVQSIIDIKVEEETTYRYIAIRQTHAYLPEL